jgi:rhamnosyl/mannosyltransferase
VLTYHNDIGKAGFLGSLITKAYNGTMGNLLLRHADLVIATSRSYATNSPRLNRLEKVRVIPNGVDHEEFHPALDGNMVASKHGLNNRRKVVLFVGKIDEYKGCEYLVRAFALVARKFADSRLLVVGEGPLRIKMSKLARDLQISSQVIFTGKVSDSELPSYYAACDVFVLPSISFQEGFGMVQLEAMASAKPVITTTIPGVREVDPDGVATIHVPPKSEQALASAITALLQDDELREKMSKNAREKAEQYSWKRVVRKLEEVYEETSTRAPSVA